MAPLLAFVAVEGVVGITLFTPAMLAVPDMPTSRAVSCAALFAYLFRRVICEGLLEVRLFLHVVVGCVFLLAGHWILTQVDPNGALVDDTQLFEVGKMLAHRCYVSIGILLYRPGVNLHPAARVGCMAGQFLFKGEASYFVTWLERILFDGEDIIRKPERCS